MNCIRQASHALTVLGLLLAMAASVQAGEDIQPGLWELSLTMTAAGSPQAVGPFNHTQCLTQADARDPEKLFTQIGGECSYGDRRYQGNRFSFTIQCGGAMPMRGSGVVEYSGSHLQGELLLNANVPGAGPLETRSQISGSRRGDC